MDGTNFILLNADTVMEALQDYLNKHAKPGFRFEVGSWGMQRFSAGEWCAVEFTEERISDAPGS